MVPLFWVDSLNHFFFLIFVSRIILVFFSLIVWNCVDCIMSDGMTICMLCRSNLFAHSILRWFLLPSFNLFSSLRRQFTLKPKIFNALNYEIISSTFCYWKKAIFLHDRPKNLQFSPSLQVSYIGQSERIRWLEYRMVRILFRSHCFHSSESNLSIWTTDHSQYHESIKSLN